MLMSPRSAFFSGISRPVAEVEGAMLSQDTGFMASINAYEYTDNRYNRSVEKRFSVQGATKYILSGSARDRVS